MVVAVLVTVVTAGRTLAAAAAMALEVAVAAVVALLSILGPPGRGA